MSERSDLFFQFTIVAFIFLCHNTVSVNCWIIHCQPCGHNDCTDCEWGTIVRSSCNVQECAMGPSEECGWSGVCADHLVCVDNRCTGCIKNEGGIDVCSHHARAWHLNDLNWGTT